MAEQRTGTPDSPLEYDDGGYRSPSMSSEDSFLDKGTHYSSTSSRRVLTHVLARKERDVKQMNHLLRLAFNKLDQESQRASDAERRASECLIRARSALDARALAEAEASRTREELAMYKVQLEQAQREIYRAQEMVEDVDARRKDAEEEAAKSRSVARQLKEKLVLENAREQGRRAGRKEGYGEGWRLGYQQALAEQGSRSAGPRGTRSRSRPRRGLQDVLFDDEDEDLEDQSPIGPVEESSSSGSSSMIDVPMRGVPETSNGSRVAPGQPYTAVPPVPTLVTPFRSPTPDPQYALDPSRYARAPARLHTPAPSGPSTADPARHRTPEPSRHRTPEPRYAPPPRQHIPPPDEDVFRVPSRSRTYSNAARPIPPPRRFNEDVDGDAVPAPQRPRTSSNASRPRPVLPRLQTPHRDGPETIHPISVRNNSPSVAHRPISVPPDGWIPHAQTMSDGRASIFLPPPHELSPSRGPQESFIIVPTPEGGSPSVGAEQPGMTMQDASSSTSLPSRRGDVRTRDYAYPAGRPLRAPAPPPPALSKAQSNASRGSTRLSEYELLAPVDESRSQRGPPPATVEDDDELEYADPPGARPLPSARPPSRPRSNAQDDTQRMQNQHPPLRRGPPRPREIVLPAPLAPAAEQLSRPPTRVGSRAGQRYDPQRQMADFPPSERPRDRPHRSRTASSGVPGISVEPPSPGNSPPSPVGTNITNPGLLSPDTLPPPLPVAPESLRDSSAQNFANMPQNFAPSRPSSRSRRSRTPAPIYEAAPIPPGVEYPASPLVRVATAGKPVDAQASSEEPSPPLSPLTGDNFLGISFPGRLPWRRYTADK